jgi:hypothetical protein
MAYVYLARKELARADEQMEQALRWQPPPRWSSATTSNEADACASAANFSTPSTPWTRREACFRTILSPSACVAGHSSSCSGTRRPSGPIAYLRKGGAGGSRRLPRPHRG